MDEETKREALLAAQGAKDTGCIQSVQDVDNGDLGTLTPTNTPGYQPGPGQPWNPIENPDPTPPVEPAPAAPEPTPDVDRD